MAKKRTATTPDDEPTEQSTDYPGPVAGESNARAVRNPDAPVRQAGDHTGRLSKGTAGDVQPPAPKPATKNAAETDQPAAGDEAPAPRKRAARPRTTSTGARKRTAGKHRK